jgi:hypothetical protein
MTAAQNGSSASPRKQASLNGELKSGRTHALDNTEGWYSKSSGCTRFNLCDLKFGYSCRCAALE